jgi:hypothetical protein
MVKRLINKVVGAGKKIKNLFLIASAGLIFSGCPLPYPNYPTEQPTPETTSGPTAEPTPTPTPDNDYFDFSGRVEDNEMDLGQKAYVRVYDASHPNVISRNFDEVTPIAEFLTDSNGYFSKTLDKLNSELPNGVVVRTAMTESDWENRDSYIREFSLPKGDQSDILARTVPYPDFCTKEEFKQHVLKTNPTYSKWDLDELVKIKIYKQNGSDSFNDDQIEISLDKIKNADNIEKFVNGKELDDYIEVIDSSPTNLFEEGCIIVVPNNSIPQGSEGNFGAVGVAYTQRENRKIKSGRIEINTDATGIDNPVLTHEFGHIFTSFWGHSTAPDEVTIMNQYNYTGDVLPLAADIKQAKLIYENTFNAGENPDKILGME